MMEQLRIDDLYNTILEKRENNKDLSDRLDLYSNLIVCALSHLNADNEKNVSEVINNLVRKSSELRPFMRTTDIVSSEIKLTSKQIRHEHVVPCIFITNNFITIKKKGRVMLKEDIKVILMDYGIRALLSKKENKTIDKNYKKTMPLYWSLLNEGMLTTKPNPLMRYKAIIKNISPRAI